MIRRLLCLLLAVLCFPAAVSAEAASAAEISGSEVFAVSGEPVFPPEEYEFSKRVSARYVSDTLIYTIESFTLDSVLCLLTKVWVADPERQIRKVNAPWGESLAAPLDLARQIPETVLATNASGYITRAYPDLPEQAHQRLSDQGNHEGDEHIYEYAPEIPAEPGDGRDSRQLKDQP